MLNQYNFKFKCFVSFGPSEFPIRWISSRKTCEIYLTKELLLPANHQLFLIITWRECTKEVTYLSVLLCEGIFSVVNPSAYWVEDKFSSRL